MTFPWKPNEWARDLSWVAFENEPFSNRMLAGMEGINGTPGLLCYVGQHYHLKVGIQLQVEKAVSDDLLRSDLSPETTFEDVPWPAPSVELYFEDPHIPTCLVQRWDTDKVMAAVPVRLRDRPSRFVLSCEKRGGQACTLALEASMWPDLVADRVPAQEDAPFALETDEQLAVNALARLAVKVMAYASLPLCQPQVLTRKMMHHGGKAGVRGRPARPASRVLYVQAAGREREPSHNPGRRLFLGRRGHFRFFRSEYFKTRRGQWTYIAPVPGPDGAVPPPTYRLPLRNTA